METPKTKLIRKMEAQNEKLLTEMSELRARQAEAEERNRRAALQEQADRHKQVHTTQIGNHCLG